MTQRFLILEADAVVAQDITEVLSNFALKSEIVWSSSLDTAEDALSRIDRLDAAFVGLPSDQIKAARLHERIREIGGRLVIIDDADGALEGCIFVRRPFSDRQLVTVLEEISGASD